MREDALHRLDVVIRAVDELRTDLKTELHPDDPTHDELDTAFTALQTAESLLQTPFGSDEE